MQIKLFEIRDEGTFIPAFAISFKDSTDHERWLIGRAGFGPHHAPEMQDEYVILGQLPFPDKTQYDEWKWGSNRTMKVAHKYIREHWDELKSDQVIDVQYILGERETPKISERAKEL